MKDDEEWEIEIEELDGDAGVDIELDEEKGPIEKYTQNEEFMKKAKAAILGFTATAGLIYATENADAGTYQVAADNLGNIAQPVLERELGYYMEW